MSDDFWGSIFVIAAIGGGIYWYNHRESETPPPPQIGRYQIITHENNAYRDIILDTATGDTWTWTTLVDDNNNSINENFWKISSRFSSQSDENKWITDQFKIYEISERYRKQNAKGK